MIGAPGSWLLVLSTMFLFVGLVQNYGHAASQREYLLRKYGPEI